MNTKTAAKTTYNFIAGFTVMFVVSAGAQLLGWRILNKITFK
jgi:hypothetical protein